MTDRTEKNRVFSTTKILVITTLFLISNYIIVISIAIWRHFSILPNRIHKCTELILPINEVPWLTLFHGIYLLTITLSGISADIALNK